MERRNVGIDLLKLVLMFMVCVLHTLTQGGALIACEPETATARGRKMKTTFPAWRCT